MPALRSLVALGLLLSLLVGCAGSQDAPAEPAATPLLQALELLPATATDIRFTDWAAMKQAAGVPDVTSASSPTERDQFMQALLSAAPASAFALNHLQTHAETWGWDSTDLLWEGTASADGPTLYVLKLRSDFDFAPLTARFTERGFTTSTHNGVTIYSAPSEGRLEHARRSELAILNTALIPEDQLLVLSADLAQVQAALDARAKAQPALATSAPLHAVAQELGPVAAAVLLTKPCDVINANSLSEQPGPPVQPYAVFGLGYHTQADQPQGLAVMHYPSATMAEQDLAPRQERATNGRSLVGNAPYSESLFTLDEATVRERNLVLRLNPHNAQPARLFHSLDARLFYYAACY